MSSSIILFVLVFGATMAYVGWPLVHPLLAEDEPSARERRRKHLLEEKERLMGALRDLELDLKTGKLDEADHNALGTRLKTEAAAVLKELDVLEGRKVLRAGDAPEPAPAPAPAPAAPASPFDAGKPEATPTIRVTHAELKAAMSSEAASRFCTKCGKMAKAADDKFCGKCGAALPDAD